MRWPQAAAAATGPRVATASHRRRPRSAMGQSWAVMANQGRPQDRHSRPRAAQGGDEAAQQLGLTRQGLPQAPYSPHSNPHQHQLAPMLPAKASSVISLGTSAIQSPTFSLMSEPLDGRLRGFPPPPPPPHPLLLDGLGGVDGGLGDALAPVLYPFGPLASEE